MKIAHFSDSHITAPFRAGLIPALFSKRLTGMVNLYLRRRYQLSYSERNLNRVLNDIKGRNVDYTIFSGDISSFSLRDEFLRAREIIYNSINDDKIYLIPGNHDQYTYLTSKNDLFHSIFTSKNDFASFPYPKIRIFKGEIIFLSINTARFNPLFFDASGHADMSEIARAQAFLDSIRDNIPVILVIHHSLLRPDGSKDSYFHKIRNDRDIFDFIRKNNIKHVFSGHIHKAYISSDSEFGFTQYNPGSTAKNTECGYFLYNFADGLLRDYQYISL